jgi:N-acetylneuraminic acid mutarotase
MVAISDATPGAAIYYTTNGTTPTTGSTLYTGMISVSTSETIEAIAVETVYSNSLVATAVYVINPTSTGGHWTWMSGSKTDQVPGVYGTLGVASASNVPGARQAHATWVDGSGNVWVFGGTAIDSTGAINYSNDLWKFNPATSEWTWVSGSNTVQALGVYGTLGVASPASVPGARNPGAVWVDGAGRFWLFGGIGADSTQRNGALNDLWMFDPGTSMWTWEGGNDALATLGRYGTLGVASSANMPGARAVGANWKDSSGVFWLFGGVGLDAVGNFSFLNDLWSFNPSTKQWTWVSGSTTANAANVYGTQGTPAAANVPGARANSVGWVDTSGSFWVFGGATANTAFNVENDLWTFNPATKQWTWISGASTTNATGVYGAQGVAAAGNTPGSREGGTGWADGKGNLYFFGGAGYSATGNFNLGQFNDLWRFDTTARVWTWVDGSNTPVAAPVYGTLGLAAPGNIPGSRYYTSGAVDAAGNFWLFGGTSEVANGSGLTDDLWRYQP